MTILDHDAQLTLDSELTEDERTLKQRCEADIDEFRRSFVKAGQALMTIRDNRLYRADYGTFDEYCSEHWGLKRSHVYRLIDSAKVIQILSPTGDILPTNERQVRPLTLLKQPEQIQRAWQNVLEATEGKPTTEAIENAVREVKGFTPRKSRKQPTVEPQGAIAIGALPQAIGEYTEPADSRVEDYSTVYDNENKRAHEESENLPMKETSSCNWIRDALQRRLMQILLYDQEVGMKIERLAKEHGKLPQTIVIWGIEALEALPSREEEITKLECELRGLQQQLTELQQVIATKDARVTELEQTVALKDARVTELEQVVDSVDAVKAELEEKLAASEYYCAEANTRITELERELAQVREELASREAVASIASKKEQQSSLVVAQTSTNSQPTDCSANSTQPSNTVPNLKLLIDFFDKAAETIEKPTVQIVLNNNTIVVSRNSNSYIGKHPGVLNLNSWDGLWHGRVNRDGNLFKSKDWQDWVLPILEQFASNPGANASQQGKTTGSCCFCNRVLTDARSLQTGYGEVCAKHYGLQWPLEQSGVGQPDVEQVNVGQSTSEICNLQPTPNSSHLIPLKCGDSVQVISSRHGEEIVGKTGTVLDVTDVGCLVDVEGDNFFFSETEIALFPVELPF